MYKVFFNDRIVYLADKSKGNFSSKDGICYNYSDPGELREILMHFDQMQVVRKLYIYYKDKEELERVFKSNFTFIHAAGGVVKNKEGKYLFIYRLQKWDLPKGKEETGESSEVAASREVAEECGINGHYITRELESTYHVYHKNNLWVLKKTAWFEMFYEGDEPLVPQQIEKITRAEWISKNEINKIVENTYLSIKEVLQNNGLTKLAEI